MGSRGRILVVGDDPAVRAPLALMLRERGFEAEKASDAFRALHKLEEFAAEAVLTELHMPGINGLELMDRVRASPGAPSFVMMGPPTALERAVDAMRRGATDYLAHPIDPARAELALEGAVRSARARQQAHGQRRPVLADPGFDKVVGEHAAIVSMLKVIRQIGPSRASVLLEGESGTGKGLIAEAIHRSSLRAKRPFIRLSCAELTQSLLESEIFGHEKGAFTGAAGRREGRFKQADGGTLFLDEVSEVPLPTQVKLLRFMQERAFERVGGNETLSVDVRIISASNKPLERCVQEGTFRMDLFYRLNVVPLRIPALRERRSDIPLLAGHFLRRFAVENERNVDSFSDEALAMLTSHVWTGNVRELENVIERAVVLCDGQRIETWHLPAQLADRPPSDAPPNVPGATIYDLERWAILRTLEAFGGSTSRAASVLGISPRKIQYKLHEYGRGDGASAAGDETSNDDSIERNGS